MLKPYRAPSGRVRVFDTDTNAVLAESDPRAARFVAMSDRELQLAGGCSQTPPVRIDFDVPVQTGRGSTQSAIIHAPVAPSRPVVHVVQQPTADDLKIAAMLGVTPEAFAAQRQAERSGTNGAGKWNSGGA